MIDAVSHCERLERLRSLPESFDLGDGATLCHMIPGDLTVLADIASKNPDIPAHITWAHRVVNEGKDPLSVMRSLSNWSLSGRFTISNEDAIAGYAGAYPSDHPGGYDLAYFVDKAQRGRGLARRAVGALSEELHRWPSPAPLYLSIALGNVASQRIAERLGFEPIGTVIHDDNLSTDEEQYVRFAGREPGTTPPGEEVRN